MAREQLVQRDTLLLRDSAERHSALAVGELAYLQETPTGACLHLSPLPFPYLCPLLIRVGVLCAGLNRVLLLVLYFYIYCY